jgi:transcriptional regulator with XRE-family HTH domain
MCLKESDSGYHKNEVINMNIGEQIKALRLENKISQKLLAEHLGLTQSTIANYENGIRQPNLEMLVALSDFFNVSTDFILSRTCVYDNRVSVDHSNIEVVDYFLNILLNRPVNEAYAYGEDYFQRHGLESLYFTLFRMVMTKVGWLWEVGEVSSGSEHVISHILDDMMVHFSSKVLVTKEKRANIVACTVQGERHTFGLKMLSLLLSHSGFVCRYIGEGVPFEDLHSMIIKGCDHLILSLSSTLHQEQTLKWLGDLPNIPVYLVGPGTEKIQVEDKKNVYVFKTFENAYTYIIMKIKADDHD